MILWRVVALAVPVAVEALATLDRWMVGMMRALRSTNT
jgi:hypothetical protein